MLKFGPNPGKPLSVVLLDNFLILFLNNFCAKKLKLINCHTFQKSHDSSGFNDGQKNSSDIIPSSPEMATTKCISRLNQVDKNSVTSTPNCTLPQKSLKRKCESAASTFDTSLFQSDFLVPHFPVKKSSATARKSVNISTSSLDSSLDDKSSDNFYIPETQQCQGKTDSFSHNSDKKNSSTTDNSINVNRQSRNQSNIEKDDEFCIPETQELTPNFGIKFKKLLDTKQLVVDTNLPEEILDDTSGSQFRICTQDFNDGENLDDPNSSLLFSLEIPWIKHKPVFINNSTEVSSNTEKVEENRGKKVVLIHINMRV